MLSAFEYPEKRDRDGTLQMVHRAKRGRKITVDHNVTTVRFSNKSNI